MATSVWVGCGAPQGGGEAESSAAASGDTEDQAKLEPPAEAVARFLDAVRRGDDKAATAMFTPLARQRADEIGLAVAPRGSDTATFEVGKVEYVSGDVAHVDSTWSDLAEDGHRHTDHIRWIVHKVPEGWRVGGMTAEVFPDQPPLALDFENPEEMLKKLEAFRDEMARRSQADEPLQAQRPKPSQDSFRR